ncbi:unnamed protein product [Didymodactylos carnosus]|uniref:Uncharacterized protein n=1 Tax=Didymodactylos carnosus TaxID=1234261 RepID=A0A8S2SFW4_9BILA|nr:unnamed protein product [Didymodactylos carnosus]CAF4227633.1 unnamed protein product [Didymodactylos carnosus]
MLDKRDASTNVDTPESVDPQASLYTLYTAIDLHSKDQQLALYRDGSEKENFPDEVIFNEENLLDVYAKKYGEKF